MLIEIFLAFITGFINLLGGNSSITALIIFISNIVIFLIYGFNEAIHSNRKGFISGIINGFILIITLFLLNLILFQKHFALSTLLYLLPL